jgi:hypothetical protein
VLDPADGRTFWSANEYIGDDGNVDIWRMTCNGQWEFGGRVNLDCKKQCIAFVNKPDGD